METLKVGDIVALKSGSPRMTVTKIGDNVETAWIVLRNPGLSGASWGKLRRANFPPEVLIILPDRN